MYQNTALLKGSFTADKGHTLFSCPIFDRARTSFSGTRAEHSVGPNAARPPQPCQVGEHAPDGPRACQVLRGSRSLAVKEIIRETSKGH